MLDIQCYQCRNSWTVDPPVGRKDECPKCGADAKVCLNCKFYDANAYHECLEEQAEWVENKDRGNFCDYFLPRAHSNQENNTSKEDELLRKLFGETEKKSAPPSKLEQELEDFFKKRS